jgi:cell division protein ZapE
VVLVDRLYDREVPVLLSLAADPDATADDAPVEGSAGDAGVLEDLFSEELLRSGYRKKYFRALSRLASLARDGRVLSR